MAKKRKPASLTRRSSRRGKQAGIAADGGESSTAAEPTVPGTPADQIPASSEASTATDEEKPSTSDQQTSTLPAINPNRIPTVVLHKKFGKYRCLFNNDDTFTRKYDVGSDSETNSSVEIRIVDPCASSESDSNAAPDTNSDACFSPTNSMSNAAISASGDVSPVSMLNENPPPSEIPLPADNIKMTDNIELKLVPLPPLINPEPVSVTEVSMLQQTEICQEDKPVKEEINVSEQVTLPNEDIPLPPMEEEGEVEYVGDDDEMITIVQIVEDDNDNPELYYDIKIDSPKDQVTEHVNEEIHGKNQDADFEEHFEKLNLAAALETDNKDLSMTVATDINLTIDCSQLDSPTPPCNTPEMFHKENLDFLTRPDPSLTPSSTLSDDSNSSRVTEQNQNNSNDSSESSPSGVRRSSRIKTISNLKQKTKGYGLVKTPLKKALITQTKLKLEELGSDSQEKSMDMSSNAPNSPTFPVPSDMPVKVKSRWRRSSELEMGASSPASSPLASPNLPQRLQPLSEAQLVSEEESGVIPISKEAYDKIIDDRMRQYQHLEENEYVCERMISRETKKMICDCFMTKDELERGELACGEDCLNRLLMIECNSRCPVGDRCTNRRFQKRQNAALKVFYADKKGCGVEASVDIPPCEFLMEYVGEVLDYDQFYKRAQAYSDENNLHHYFMSLKGDTVIDATLKGNISRFINHSCDPNAETQKWTVNGELRIGFFSKRDILPGEEITFDYQFQRFGKVAQRCYCGADNCRGWIGAEPDSDDDDEEEEEDVSTSKSGATESSEESRAADASAETPRARAPRPRRVRKYKPKAKELVQDADIEEDLEALSRTGVKNQSHTLRLSRTVVRAKARRAQTALLRLLRDADLPCRRLFLDYRGLRLLAPWCTDAPLHFRLEMLQTVDRLPVPNKTMVQESRFFTIVERWLSATDAPVDIVLTDESTGLPVELPNRPAQDVAGVDKTKENAAMLEKVKDLSKQLLERWSSLKEVFKIPKKERIQQMKEHERQANVERRAADSSGSRDRDRDRDRDRRDERDRERERERDRERDRDRERERERYRERERDRDRDRDDRDRRKRRGSPEGRRSIRLSERVLAAVPPMSKEERRRAFAEAAAAAEESRRQRDQHHYHYWPPDGFAQMFPPGMMGAPPNMLVPGGLPAMPGLPALPGLLPPDMPPDWRGPPPADFQPPPGFCPPFAAPQAFCMPQPNMGVMGMSGFGMGGFMFGQQMPGPFPPHAQLPPLAQPPLLVEPAQTALAPACPRKESVLPSLWRSAVDGRGRTYYYHVKLRQPQWEPPSPPPDLDESSSEEEEAPVTPVDTAVVRRPAKGKLVEGVNGIYEVIKEDSHNGLIPEHALLTIKPRKRRPGLVSERPISPRTEEDKLAGRMEVKRYKQTKEKLRRRRERLLQKVRLLSAVRPRRATQLPSDFKIDLVDSESDSTPDSDEPVVIAASPPAVPAPAPAPDPDPEPEAAPLAPAAPMQSTAPRAPTVPTASPAPSPSPASASAPAPASPQPDAEEVARKIKEQFRSTMARVMVQHLNPFRHSEAKAGRITCTADFKHLARKLTHFVMLKELKHCRSVEELVVTDSVRSKAKMFVKKYMAKFGPVYKRPPEEVD